jgi:hypothetical protein
MSCAEIRPLLAVRPSGALDDDEEGRVMAHLSGCSTCQSEARAIETAFGKLAEPELPPAPPEVWERVRAELDARPPVQLALPRRLLTVGAFAVALVAVGVARVERQTESAQRALERANLRLAAQERLSAARFTLATHVQLGDAERLDADLREYDMCKANEDLARDFAELTETRLGRDLASAVRSAPPTRLLEVARALARGVPDHAPAVFEVLATRARELAKNAKTPEEWVRAEQILQAALELSIGPGHAEILREIEVCRVNREGEDLYAQALEAVQKRDPNLYKDALAKLQRIDSRARVHYEAHNVIEWIDADLAVRRAREEYDAMNITRASMLLDEAAKAFSIGRDAKTSIAERRARWTDVAKAFEAGRAAYESVPPDLARADVSFKQVLQLETSKTNRYNILARKFLGFITDTAKSDLEDNFTHGVECLKRTPPDLDEAFGYFTVVLRQAEGQKALDYRRRIGKEVDTYARNGKWLEKANNHLLRDDQAQLGFILDASRLLSDFLPNGHEDKKKATDLYKTVSKRIRAMEKSANDGE